MNENTGSVHMPATAPAAPNPSCTPPFFLLLLLLFLFLLLFFACLLLGWLLELVSSGGREHKCVCVCVVLLGRMRTEAQKGEGAFHRDLSQLP